MDSNFSGSHVLLLVTNPKGVSNTGNCNDTTIPVAITFKDRPDIAWVAEYNKMPW